MKPGTMTERPIAYLMEQTLGNVTHYLNLRNAQVASGDASVRWLPIDYREGKLPWTVTGGWLARRALSPVLQDVSGIFIHTTTLALLCMDQWRHKPTVLSTDGTPANKRNMRQAYGLRPQPRGLERAKRLLYSQVYGSAAGLVGWSNWVKQSFVEDYGYREEDIAVVPPGVDVASFARADREHERPRLLFVGGDFERKGGRQLLEVFRSRLRDKAELVVVTRDPVAEEPGVRVHRGVAANSPELRQLYATCNVFVLPTLADCFSLAAMEALAAGLPVVATRVGGIPDIVRDGVTGYLVDPGDADALGDALETLARDSGLRQRMGGDARADALSRFDATVNAERLFQFVRSRC